MDLFAEDRADDIVGAVFGLGAIGAGFFFMLSGFVLGMVPARIVLSGRWIGVRP